MKLIFSYFPAKSCPALKATILLLHQFSWHDFMTWIQMKCYTVPELYGSISNKWSHTLNISAVCNMCTNSIISCVDDRERMRKQLMFYINPNVILIHFPMRKHIRSKGESGLYTVRGRNVTVQANDHIHCSEKVLYSTCDSCCYTTKPHNRSSSFTGICDILFVTRLALSFCDHVSLCSQVSIFPTTRWNCLPSQ